MTEPMPAIFFGLAIRRMPLTNNRHSEGWRRIGEQTIKTNGILSISGLRETAVTFSTAGTLVCSGAQLLRNS